MQEPTEESGQSKDGIEPSCIRLTAQLTMDAYDAIIELRRQYRRKTGRNIPIWRLLDTAVIAYAREYGIKVGK